MSHTPVLLNEVLDVLDPKPGEKFVDGTVDGGGHAEAILEKLGPKGKLLGVEWDEKVLATGHARLGARKNAKIVHGNYADVSEILKKEKFGAADGLLLDLGFSSEQLAESGRGFSFSEASRDEPLLMTYDDSREPVRDILRQTKEADLANLIFEFGGERQSRRIAKAIIEHGRRRRIETAGELANVIRSALPKNYERGRIDPATRTFQALRIYANDELGNLSHILRELGSFMNPGGRVAIITFHSLEDRIVKNAFRDMAKEGSAVLIMKKPIVASREEIRENPRSRSAKLRGIKLSE